MAKKGLDKPSRKIKVLLLVEVEAMPSWHVDTDAELGPVLKLTEQAGGSRVEWTPAAIAQAASKALNAFYSKHECEPWYVKSVKEATAP